jgi:hypothetical protein
MQSGVWQQTKDLSAPFLFSCCFSAHPSFVSRGVAWRGVAGNCERKCRPTGQTSLATAARMHLLHTNQNLRATAAQWTSLSGLWPLHAVRKRLFRNAIVRLKNGYLSRQARDNHTENLRERRFLCRRSWRRSVAGAGDGPGDPFARADGFERGGMCAVEEAWSRRATGSSRPSCRAALRPHARHYI